MGDSAAHAGDPDPVAAALAHVPGFAAGSYATELVVRGRAHDVHRAVAADGSTVALRLPRRPRVHAGALSAPRNRPEGADASTWASTHRAARAECDSQSAAAAVGVAPTVLWCDPSTGAMVSEWIDGRALTTDELADATQLSRVAALCRRLHDAAATDTELDIFAAQRGYRHKADAAGIAVPPGYDELAVPMAEAEAVLRAGAEASVACHNDLVASNILDDGSRLWLVDFEYAGTNDPCFELGYLWNEARLGLDRLDELVHAYYGRSRPDRAARARLYALAADYAGTLWASLEAATDISAGRATGNDADTRGVADARGTVGAAADVDLRTWAAAAYERARGGLHSAEFDRLLAAAHRHS